MVRALLGTLAGIVFLRVLGVSLLLAGWVDHWKALGGTEAGAGMGFAAYPMALALLMIPLGHLSDRLGRRPVMVGALLVSVAGGLLAAFAPTPGLLAFGRFVAGAGAVNGVALAVAGEAGDPAARTRRMALLGASAGGGFLAGLLGGALLHRLGLEVPDLLLLHALLTLATVPAAARWIPRGTRPPDASPTPGRHGAAFVLGAGAFAVNFTLTGLLLFSPLLLPRAAPGLPYEGALVLMVLPAGFGMYAASRLADRGHAQAVGVGAALLLGVTPLAWLGAPGAVLLVLSGVLFFLGHSSLSALLPSLAARLAPPGRRGLAQGIQGTLQYLGSAAGSAVVAWLHAHGSTPGLAAVFLGAGGVVALVVWRAARAATGALRMEPAGAPAPPPVE